MITRRKEVFIYNVFQGKTPTESARLAGYTERSAYTQGSRLMKNVEVCRALEQLREADRVKCSVTRELISLRLNREAENAIKASDRINANAILAKLHNFYTDNTLNINTAMYSVDMETRKQAVLSRRLDVKSNNKPLSTIPSTITELSTMPDTTQHNTQQQDTSSNS